MASEPNQEASHFIVHCLDLRVVINTLFLNKFFYRKPCLPAKLYSVFFMPRFFGCRLLNLEKLFESQIKRTSSLLNFPDFSFRSKFEIRCGESKVENLD